MPELNRRSFLAKSAGAAATGVLLSTSKTSWAGANDRVNAACIGLHGRGINHIEGLQGLEGVEVTTLCDVDRNVLEGRAGGLEKRTQRSVKRVTDMREVFDDPDIDVVSIATPNHWHSLATIWACQAGKDVYVEKPGSHNLFEGRKMIEAAHKYNRVVQHGVQLRSSPAIQEAVKLLREGVIGRVYMARGLCFRTRDSIGHKPVEAVPPELDYNLWLGPAPDQPFTRNKVHYNWHWMWDFGNGDLGNQGSHETDMCLWGLGVDKLPNVVTSMGGKFLWDDDKETPEVLASSFHYPDQDLMIEFEVRPWRTNREDNVAVGNIFYGSEGYMKINGYSSYATFLGSNGEPGPARGEGGDHFANFIDVVRSRRMEDLNAPVETAHMAAGLCHLANISYRVGRTLQFDPESETFVDDVVANKFLSRDYRRPFVVPHNV